MRRDAIYPSIVVGKPPQEDAWLGKATERIFLPAIRMTVPEIVDYDLPVAGAFHNCVHRLDPQGVPGHAQKVMHAIWGLGMLSSRSRSSSSTSGSTCTTTRRSSSRVGANVDPKRDVLLTEGPLDHLDHAPTQQFYGGKIGIDATHKGELEGTREWPELIEMTAEVRALVDRRWSEYGIDLPIETNGTSRGRLLPGKLRSIRRG
jgi:4-hydroxy-3-polyprenylbenzoate decarboxylase